MEENTIKISVRNLVEFVLCYGDLNSDFSSSSRNTDAIKVHQKIQKSSGEDYASEITLKYLIHQNEYDIEISGRADGIIENSDGITIDEIKTTNADLELITENYNILHWAQAKCYAFIYAAEKNIDFINVQLTYYQMESGHIKRFINTYSFEELKSFFAELIEKYVYWANRSISWKEVRNISIKNLEFPFSVYRRGQRELAVGIYRTVRDGGKLFAEAPTGTGKTVAAAFPAVKAMGEGHVSKIFYLTAKTIARTSAENAFLRLREKGLKLKTITLTAKDKICFNKDSKCNAEECEYAKGYYDRVKNALDDILNEENMTRDKILSCSEKYKICPFEFSLELTNWCDCVICDYNYVFDPRVYLKRFFLEGGDYALLVDEAHNLVDRSREMFSAELMKAEVLDLKRKTKTSAQSINKVLTKINSAMVEIRKKCDEKNSFISKEQPTELYPHLRKFIEVCEKWLMESENTLLKDDILDFYFKVLAFIRTSELYDERYTTYAEKMKEDLKIKLFCLDPSELLREAQKKASAVVFFSATLTPMDYYIKVLGGDENSIKISLPSPFPKDNLKVFVNDRISTLYKDRENTYNDISKCINAVVKQHKGNYLVFFPSYKYMNMVYDLMPKDCNGIKIIRQEIEMSEEQREVFLKEFNEHREDTLIGFAVMGGIFGEGIDLVGERLCGAVIVGVGLPKLNLERNIINEYFNGENGMGFEYAYVYPGINKVMQAAGRVIRTETDRGIIMLIDRRFLERRYLKLLPRNWMPFTRVNALSISEKKTSEFWSLDI